MKSPADYELIPQKGGALTHVRSGHQVHSFEVFGTRQNGTKFAAGFAGDLDGFRAAQHLAASGTAWVVLANKEKVKLEGLLA